MGRNELIYELQPNRKAITFFKRDTMNLEKVEYDTKWRIHQATTSVPFWCNFLFSFSSPLSSLSSFSFSSYHLTQRSFYISFFYSQLQRTKGESQKMHSIFSIQFFWLQQFWPSKFNNFSRCSQPIYETHFSRAHSRTGFSASFGVSVEVCDWLWSTNHTNKPTYNPYQLRKVIDEIDRRFALIPPFDGLIIFPNGISKITIQNKGKFQGKEYRNVMKVSTSPPKNMNWGLKFKIKT